ncbi:MAG: hypothetical protein AAF500_19000 [Myxococcota bacterium]
MSVDYDQASRGCDETRRFDGDVIDEVVARATLGAQSKTLDIGCGTGNYLAELERRFSCECYMLRVDVGSYKAVACTSWWLMAVQVACDAGVAARLSLATDLATTQRYSVIRSGCRRA